jgi:hypothetical protein
MMLLTWDMLALMGITISFLIVTLVFMLSYMFSNDFLKSWSKEEFLNVFMTLILFGTLFSLVNLPIFRNNIDSANSYISSVFNNSISTQIDIIEDISVLSLISSLSFFINPNQIMNQDKGAGGAGGAGNENAASDSLSIYISLSPFVSPFLTSITSIQIYSMIPISMIKLHHLLIDFIRTDSLRTFPILLAAGLFLRAFKFTRNAGNTILALFIALYFVMPVIYLFNQALSNTVLGKSMRSPVTNEGDGFVTDLVDLLRNEIKGGWSLETGDILDEPSSIGDDLYKLVTKNGKMYKFIVRFFFEALLLPYLAIIISLGLAREFALSLGSNIDFSSLVRLV